MKLTDSVLNVVIPLLLGAFIYLNTNSWPALPFLRNYAADGLWSYAFTSAILIIWERSINYPWLAVTALTGILFEWMQYAQVINGTADLYDLISYTTGLMIALSVNKYFNNNL